MYTRTFFILCLEETFEQETTHWRQRCKRRGRRDQWRDKRCSIVISKSRSAIRSTRFPDSCHRSYDKLVKISRRYVSLCLLSTDVWLSIRNRSLQTSIRQDFDSPPALLFILHREDNDCKISGGQKYRNCSPISSLKFSFLLSKNFLLCSFRTVIKRSLLLTRSLRFLMKIHFFKWLPRLKSLLSKKRRETWLNHIYNYNCNFRNLLCYNILY